MARSSSPQLPYQVSGAKIQEQIAAQINAKKLPMVENFRDESDHEHPTRIVIVPKSNRVDLVQVMNHLFATTDLERTYRVNLNIIGLDGKPRVMGLKPLLEEWLKYRIDTVTRRLQWRLEKVQVAPAHLGRLAGRVSESRRSDPHHSSRGRAEAGADEALQDHRDPGRRDSRHAPAPPRQAGRNEDPRRAGRAAAEQDKLDKLLGSKAKLKKLVRDELEADAKEFGDDRRSQASSSAPLRWPSMRPSWSTTEPMTVILSERGWVRAAKGHEIDPTSISYKTGDAFLAAAKGKSTQQAVFLDSTGRTYTLIAHSVAVGARQRRAVVGSPRSAGRRDVLGRVDRRSGRANACWRRTRAMASS